VATLYAVQSRRRRQSAHSPSPGRSRWPSRTQDQHGKSSGSSSQSHSGLSSASSVTNSSRSTNRA